MFQGATELSTLGGVLTVDRVSTQRCSMNGTTLNAGALDGKTLVEMNNLAVGYFPSQSPEIAVYPPPVPELPPAVEEQAPVTLELR